MFLNRPDDFLAFLSSFIKAINLTSNVSDS